MKILVATAGPVPAKDKAEYIMNIANGLAQVHGKIVF